MKATGKEARTRGREKQDVDTSWESEPRHDTCSRRGDEKAREMEEKKENRVERTGG